MAEMGVLFFFAGGVVDVEGGGGDAVDAEAGVTAVVDAETECGDVDEGCAVDA